MHENQIFLGEPKFDGRIMKKKFLTKWHVWDFLNILLHNRSSFFNILLTLCSHSNNKKMPKLKYLHNVRQLPQRDRVAHCIQELQLLPYRTDKKINLHKPKELKLINDLKNKGSRISLNFCFFSLTCLDGTTRS